MDFAFRRLSEKQNNKSFLCELCGLSEAGGATVFLF
jgi:hypothetical protein